MPNTKLNKVNCSHKNHTKIGFGGSCHWCTEAVFQSLVGVHQVDQGWIGANNESTRLSEAVIVYFDSIKIDIPTLVAIHLYSHSCTSNHPMRAKYRSAVYTFSDHQVDIVNNAISTLQIEYDEPILTQVLPFVIFKENEEVYLNYYNKNTGNQFCETYINPKLKRLSEKFSKYTKHSQPYKSQVNSTKDIINRMD